MQATGRDDAPRRAGWLLWVAWVVVLAVFTYGLLAPEVPGRGWIPPEWRFAVAKAVHVGGYALLTMLTAWLPVPLAVRLGLLAFLGLHACGTEYVQTFVAGRSGTLQDIGIDVVGVILGAALTWRRWFPER